MRLITYLGAAALGLSLLAGNAGSALAQSDTTLGINCKVAGHERCGNGYYGYYGRYYVHHRRRAHGRRYYYYR